MNLNDRIALLLGRAVMRAEVLQVELERLRAEHEAEQSEQDEPSEPT